MNRVRIAVIGAGHLGTIHSRLLASIDHVDMVGVVDPDPAARARIADSLQVQTWADHQQLDGKIDAAIIATPTCCHYDVAADLLDRHVHVFIEKPITESTEEANELIAIAQRHRCVLQVGHVERFNAAWTAAVPYMSHPRFIEATRGGPYSFRSTDVSIVLDLMIHDIDLILSLVRSRVTRVEALGMALLGPREDIAYANVHFANGCVANLNASRVSSQPARQMRVFSPAAFAAIDFAAGTARLTHLSESVRTHTADLTACPVEHRDGATRQIQEVLLPEQVLDVEPVNAILEEQRDFLQAIHTGQPVRVDGSQARNALAIAQEILYSIQTHRWNGEFHGPVGPRAVMTPVSDQRRRAA